MASKTFQLQSKLPRLPIPDLNSTISKYLVSLAPFPAFNKAETHDAVSKFLQDPTQGPLLQQRLYEYDRKQKNSWLEDIWYRKAYLEWPEPVMINVNWWLEFIPRKRDIENKDLNQINPHLPFRKKQISIASELIRNLVDIHLEIQSEKYPVDTMGRKNVPLCMNQYKMLFGVSRIPGNEVDSIYHEFPQKSRHITLIIRDNIYKLPVINEKGLALSIDELKDQIKKCIDIQSKSEQQPSIGILTSQYRPEWAKYRHRLEQLSDMNKANLKCIDESLITVCLDDFETPDDIDLSHRNIFHGNNGRNRWFDKSLSFIFDLNGKGGCSGEHSPSDAVTPASVIRKALLKEPQLYDSVGFVEEPELLSWNIDQKIEKAIEAASARAEEDIEDLDSSLLKFDEFGGDDIKKRAGCSPDAFVQMIIQLAHWKMYQTNVPTYESASTRQFLHGRTETIRSCTKESILMCEGLDNSSKTAESKAELFGVATKIHSKNTISATFGQGIDRHLLGLKSMLTSDEANSGSIGQIFRDPAFLGSMSFKLSTSNVSPGDCFYGGFGPVMSDGYGINYAIGKESLRFSVSARRVSGNTCSRSFRRVIEETLRDTMRILDKVGGVILK